MSEVVLDGTPLPFNVPIECDYCGSLNGINHKLSPGGCLYCGAPTRLVGIYPGDPGTNLSKAEFAIMMEENDMRMLLCGSVPGLIITRSKECI